MTSYFSNLFTLEGCTSEVCLDAITSSISRADNEALLASFSDLEVKEAIMSGYLQIIST